MTKAKQRSLLSQWFKCSSFEVICFFFVLVWWKIVHEAAKGKWLFGETEKARNAQQKSEMCQWWTRCKRNLRTTIDLERQQRMKRAGEFNAYNEKGIAKMWSCNPQKGAPKRDDDLRCDTQSSGETVSHWASASFVCSLNLAQNAGGKQTGRKQKKLTVATGSPTLFVLFFSLRVSCELSEWKPLFFVLS